MSKPDKYNESKLIGIDFNNLEDFSGTIKSVNSSQDLPIIEEILSSHNQKDANEPREYDNTKRIIHVVKILQNILKEKLIELKGKIDESTFITRDFPTFS